MGLLGYGDRENQDNDSEDEDGLDEESDEEEESDFEDIENDDDIVDDRNNDEDDEEEEENEEDDEIGKEDIPIRFSGGDRNRRGRGLGGLLRGVKSLFQPMVRTVGKAVKSKTANCGKCN